jgi:hypothetical protein
MHRIGAGALQIDSGRWSRSRTTSAVLSPRWRSGNVEGDHGLADATLLIEDPDESRFRLISTITAPITFESVGLLAAIVLIRTFLSFSLETKIEGCWPWQRAAKDAGRSELSDQR